mgnify:CR=1 FL=1
MNRATELSGILAAPERLVTDTRLELRRVALEHVPAGALVTDAGSTKCQIVDTARDSIARGQFLGGHPMAGREVSGSAGARKELFDDRLWVLTPLAATGEEHRERVHRLVENAQREFSGERGRKVRKRTQRFLANAG